MNKLLNREDFDIYLSAMNDERKKKWNLRWDYHWAVVGILSKLKFHKSLELGCNSITVVNDSDCMITNDIFPASNIGKKINHNALNIPWPVEDKYYDVFVALQVWEHLGGKKSGNQAKVFQEVMRVSKMAVLSFPINGEIKEGKILHIRI